MLQLTATAPLIQPAIMPQETSPSPEWSVLLAACCSSQSDEKTSRLRSLLQQQISWNVLIKLAERHRVLALLFHSLRAVGDAVPPEELLVLKQSYQANLHKALLLSRELIRILDHLSGAQIEVMSYKGLALAEMLYNDIAARQAGDIDLLIRSRDFSRIRAAVGELGYVPPGSLSEAEEHAYLKSGYECAFDGPAGRNLLEVHWAAQPRFYAIDFDMEGLFGRAIDISIAGHSAKTPAHADLLLLLSAHAAKHVWGRLIWLCDIAHLMEQPGVDWDWVASQARKLGMVRILRITMLVANRLLDARIPEGARKISEDAAALEIAREVHNYITSDLAYDVESFAYFRLMMRLRERGTDRSRFLTRLIFTPGPGEWQAVRLPQSLFPLYRLVRLSRLASRIVRTQ